MESRNRKILLVVGSIFGGFALCMLLCCGGMNFFFGMMADNVRLKLEADPEFSGRVGQIQEIKHNFFAGIGSDDNIEVYDVKGSKWSGRLTLKQENQFDVNAAKILWVRFTLPSGEVVEIKPGRKPADAPPAEDHPPADHPK